MQIITAFLSLKSSQLKSVGKSPQKITNEATSTCLIFIWKSFELHVLTSSFHSTVLLTEFIKSVSSLGMNKVMNQHNKQRLS